jgi:DNA repair protein RadC
MTKKTTRKEDAAPYAIPVYRLRLVQDGTADVSPLTAPADVARHLGDVATSDREQMVALFLDTKNRPIGRHLVSVGTVDSTPVQPRDVFRAALVAGAVNGIILAHNHPSGDVTPSRCDDEVTRLIARAGTLLGIRLLDHVVLAPDGSHFSYRDRRPDCVEG